MELKITADKKLLDVIGRLTEALEALQPPVMTEKPLKIDAQPAAAPVAAPTPEPKEESAPAAEPVTEPPAAVQTEAPSRDEIQRLAIVKIQAGKGAAVKALVTKYGAARVKEVPENKLAEFKAELEALA